MLESSNPFHRARAIWLLAGLGEEGKKEVEKLLDDRDEAIRAVAFRALRHHSDDIVKYAQHLVEDPSPFVKREIILGLADYPYPVKKPILLQLLKNFDPSDRWYLEALGNAVSGHEEDFILEAEKLFNKGKQNQKRGVTSLRCWCGDCIPPNTAVHLKQERNPTNFHAFNVSEP